MRGFGKPKKIGLRRWRRPLPLANERSAIRPDFLVFDFLSQGLGYLLGYLLDDRVKLVCLEAIGPHENFYRDLKGR